VGQRPPVYAPVLAEYALLTWAQGGRRDDPEEPYQRWPGPPLTESQVVRPAETIGLIDGWTTTRWSGESRPRHGGWLIAAFVDGHVGWLTRKQLGRVERDDQGRYWLVYGSAHR
jgi:prepilin-type processing-associated H-X9-DG protein